MLPGPLFAVPLVGGMVQMVMDPYKFWEDQRQASFPGVRPANLRVEKVVAPFLFVSSNSAVLEISTGTCAGPCQGLHLILHMILPVSGCQRLKWCTCAGLSYNSILGKLMVFSTDVEVSRRMLSVNDESTLLMAVHPSAKHILGPNNLAFMHGPPHKARPCGSFCLREPYDNLASGSSMHI